MADINNKYVLYYAPKGYRSSLTVTISIYDTAGTTEINSQSMTELENTGVYYFNWFPKKRTTYLAVMDCVQRPYKSHQIIRIEKTKLAGAISIPRVPKTFTDKDKDLMFEDLKRLKLNLSSVSEGVLQNNEIITNSLKKQTEQNTKILAELQNAAINFKEEANLANAQIKKTFQQSTATLDKSSIKTTSQLNETKECFDKLTNEFKTEVNKLSQDTIMGQLNTMHADYVSLSASIEEVIPNLNVAKQTFSSNIKNKINSIAEQTDELLVLIKNGKGNN